MIHLQNMGLKGTPSHFWAWPPCEEMAEATLISFLGPIFLEDLHILHTSSVCLWRRACSTYLVTP